MRATIPALLLALLPACGGAEAPTSTTPGAPPVPKSDKQQLANLSHFDVGTLSPTPPAIPARVNKDVLLGVEMTARPTILECLVDPKNRGADKLTKVVVDATLVDAGVEHKVSGANLTPAGTACIEGALKKWTDAAAGLNAKAAAGGAVSARLEVGHEVGNQPAVVMGINEASDVAGAVRAALPGWADCFADWKSAPPRALKGSVKVTKAPGAAEVSPAEVSFEPAGDPAADKVAACLKGKIAAMKLKAPKSDAVTVPLPLRFVHSGVASPLGAEEPPHLQFAQLDLLRARRLAEVAIAEGSRALAAAAYDDAVKRYKAGAKEVSVLELKDKCAALLAADDKAIEALQKQVEVETKTHDFAAAQKAKDAGWEPAETLSAQKLAEAQKDVQSFQQNRKADEAACPKVR
jgi:hypothetical protein